MGLSRKQILYLYATGVFQRRPSGLMGNSRSSGEKSSVRSAKIVSRKSVGHDPHTRLTSILTNKSNKIENEDARTSLHTLEGFVRYKDYGGARYHYDQAAKMLPELSASDAAHVHAALQSVSKLLKKSVPQLGTSQTTSQSISPKSQKVETPSTTAREPNTPAEEIPRSKVVDWAKQNLPTLNTQDSSMMGSHPGLKSYLGHGFDMINGSLQGLPHISPEDHKLASQAVKEYQDLAKPIPQALKVFRGFNGDLGEDVLARHKRGELIGSDIQYGGFSSTSLVQEAATRYATDWLEGKGQIVMEVNVPKGTKGLYVDIGEKPIQQGSEARGNYELLLGPNQTYRVRGVRKQGRYTIVSADLHTPKN